MTSKQPEYRIMRYRSFEFQLYIALSLSLLKLCAAQTLGYRYLDNKKTNLYAPTQKIAAKYKTMLYKRRLTISLPLAPSEYTSYDACYSGSVTTNHTMYCNTTPATWHQRGCGIYMVDYYTGYKVKQHFDTTGCYIVRDFGNTITISLYENQCVGLNAKIKVIMIKEAVSPNQHFLVHSRFIVKLMFFANE